MSWVSAYPEAYLLCRDTGIRHSWMPHTAERLSSGWRETLKCDRCGAEKTRILNRQGYPMKSPRTQYPPDYLRVGIGRASKADNAAVRVEHLKRRTK